MKIRISTPWQWTGDLYRLVKIVFQRLLLVSALSVTTLPAAEAANYALNFDGTNDHVQAAVNMFSDVVNSFTIELWANPTAPRGVTAEANGSISGFGQSHASRGSPVAKYGRRLP